MILRLAEAILLRRQRSFLDDARLSLEALPLRIVCEGLDNIPSAGAYLLTANHYARPGLPVWWAVFAVTAAAGCPVHWIITSELTFPGRPWAPLLSPLSRILLKEIGQVYGLTTMPPMPPRPQDVENRARAVRQALRYAHRNGVARIGLMPEGRDTPGAVLSPAPQGTGRFALLLNQADLLTLPVGIFEREGKLILRFGSAYSLAYPEGRPGDREAWASEQLMAHIAGLLPQEIRGPFDSRDMITPDPMSRR